MHFKYARIPCTFEFWASPIKEKEEKIKRKASKAREIFSFILLLSC